MYLVIDEFEGITIHREEPTDVMLESRILTIIRWCPDEEEFQEWDNGEWTPVPDGPVRE